MTASTEELTAIKTQQGEDARRHSQSLVAAKSALDEVRDRLETLSLVLAEYVTDHSSHGITAPRPSANHRSEQKRK